MSLIHFPRLAHEPAQHFGDPGDLSSLNHDRFVDAAVAGVLSKLNRTQSKEEILAAERALGKADNNCRECGCSISEARLKARPGAERCVMCEEEREKKREGARSFRKRR